MGGLPALRRRAGQALGLLLVGVALVAAALVWGTPLPARLSVSGSPVLLWRDGSVAHVGLAPDERWRMPVDLAAVDPAYVTALLALEDSRFRWHPGVDPLAIGRALGQNLRQWRVVSGASTLTLQLVRVVEPRPRTMASKLVEAARAVQIEARLSKDEVLSLYLSFAPYGGNIEGVEAASWAYFGHGAGVLDPAEICTLLAIPQAPLRRAPGRGATADLQQARDDIARRLLAAGALPLGSPDAPRSAEAVLAAVVAARVPTAARPMPRDLLHLAAPLQGARAGAAGDWRGPPPVATTLDRGVQAVAERVLRAQQPWANSNGIYNATAVVLDPTTSQVLALVGNFDFWDQQHGGQIAGFRQARSPGSTLKPLLYARALDLGLLLPETLLSDVPVRYGAYSPSNFDGSWSGVASAEAALSRSLNVPFVDLLQKVGVEAFLGTLRDLGARSPRPEPGHYGLSLVAGGIELTPLELAGMYAALARGGEWVAPTWRAEDPAARAPPLRVLSPGATWLTRRALSLRDRPDFPARPRLGGAPRGIHWKTGTSFGLRDAWAAGSTATHTAVVWMGNFDNRPSPALVGGVASAPVLFDLLEALQPAGEPPEPRAPGDLWPVEVCRLSGLPPSSDCPDTTQVLGLRQQVPGRTCPLHDVIEVDLDSGAEVRPDCRAGRRVEARVVVRWPAQVQALLRQGFGAEQSAPALDPACQVASSGGGPRIVSPPDRLVAVLLPGMAAHEQEIALEAAGASGDEWLDWFVDGNYLGRGRAGEAIWWTPVVGVHQIVLMDSEGRSDRRELQVRGGV